MQRLPLLLLLALLLIPGSVRGEESARLVDAKKIWDRAPHNAFTDLIRFKDRWFCVFREGKGHVSPDGALRVLTSYDGEKWTSAALVTSPDSDLRDAKITVTPDGQLMLSGAGAMHDKSEKTHQSLTWFSDDGRRWSKAFEVGDPNFWLWRTTWHHGKAYGIGYGCGAEKAVRLYSSQDGKSFDVLVKSLLEDEYPNETSIVFVGETAYCLLRRDGKPNTGLLGTAQAPFTEWNWKDLGVRIGGPHFTQLPDGRFVAAVRLYDKKVRTALCWLDPEQGTLTEFLALPSGGDTSYAGLVWHDDLLWVSYYASHEGKTSIYLAKVEIPLQPEAKNSADAMVLDQIFSSVASVDRASLIKKVSDNQLAQTLKTFLPAVEGAAVIARKVERFKADVEAVGGAVQLSEGGPEALRLAVGHSRMQLFSLPIGVNLYNGNNPLKGKGGLNTEVNDAWLAKLAGWTSIKRLDLANCDVHRKGLESVATLSHLEFLNLTLSPVTDEDLAPLAALTGLEELSLASTPCTGEGFQHLKSLTRLRTLNMHHAETNDAGLAAIAGVGKLERLWIAHTHFTDAGGKYLATHGHLNRLGIGSKSPDGSGEAIAGAVGLPLTELELYDGQATDAALKYAARIPTLQMLNVAHGPTVTDAMLPELGKLPMLEELRIASSQMTDAGLAAVAVAPRLRKVVLSGNRKLTPEGIEMVRKAHPGLVIEVN